MEKLRISAKDNFFVMETGDIIENTPIDIPIKNGTKTRLYEIKCNKQLFTVHHCHTDDGITSHGWWELGVYIGPVAYTYNKKDLEDARFLIKMEEYYPDLKPNEISPTVTKVIELLTKGEIR